MSRSSVPRRPSPIETIDLDTIEVVDLTDRSPRPLRRSLPSPTTSDRPTKRAKGKDPGIYISLDDDDQDDDQDDTLDSPTETIPAIQLKPPSQSGSLSQARCVICLDSPTDLVATPCGTSSTLFLVLWFTDGQDICFVIFVFGVRSRRDSRGGGGV
jgi:hypothetical protein